MFSTAFYVSQYYIYTDCFMPDLQRARVASASPTDPSTEDS
jgi:hypothetical protein